MARPGAEPLPSRASMSHEPPPDERREGAEAAPVGRVPRAARTLPTPVFPVVLAVLLALAIGSAFVTTHPVEGLPDDPSARAARDVLAGSAAPATGGLRFGSAFFGDSGIGLAAAPDPAVIARARTLLERAHEAHPLEPRVVAALGHLALVERRLGAAEALYLTAIDLRSHCTEARLGLGVVLAVQADGSGDLFERRALQLRSLAQFLAIDGGSERMREALYDRAVMEERVGRHRDARESARAFLAIEPQGPWASRLRHALGLEGATVTGGPGRSSSGSP